MRRTRLTIDGMSCQHCVTAATGASTTRWGSRKRRTRRRHRDRRQRGIAPGLSPVVGRVANGHGFPTDKRGTDGHRPHEGRPASSGECDPGLPPVVEMMHEHTGRASWARSF